MDKIGDSERKQQLSQRHGMGVRTETFAQAVWRRFRRHRLAMIGLFVLLLMYLMAILAPWLAPYGYSEVDTRLRLEPPSSEHPLGMDFIGRDVLSRVIWGSRISLSVGFVSAGVAVFIGTLVGATAGYFGGAVDSVLMRITDVVLSFPVFFLLLTIIAVVERSIFNIMLVIGLTSWPGLARLVRGEFLSLKEREFTEAARALGAIDTRVIFRHLLPNAMAPIIVNATLRIGGAILAESGLSFLGLGVPEPYPSWGSVLNSGRNVLRIAPWITTFPGVFIFLTVLSFNFVGDGLRDALDPKMDQQG